MIILGPFCYAVITPVKLEDSQRALKYFEMGLEHFLEFKKVWGRTQFAAPLINKAKNYGPSIVLLDRKWIEEEYMQSFLPECADAIKNNPRYASIFSE